jgi:tRNA dimethylallyltransferase
VTLAQQATRNYAKRQLTWLRNQTPDWPRIADAGDPAAEALLGLAP